MLKKFDVSGEALLVGVNYFPSRTPGKTVFSFSLLVTDGSQSCIHNFSFDYLNSDVPDALISTIETLRNDISNMSFLVCSLHGIYDSKYCKYDTLVVPKFYKFEKKDDVIIISNLSK